jgi:hypothetical protein
MQNYGVTRTHTCIQWSKAALVMRPPVAVRSSVLHATCGCILYKPVFLVISSTAAQSSKPSAKCTALLLSDTCDETVALCTMCQWQRVVDNVLLK